MSPALVGRDATFSGGVGAVASRTDLEQRESTSRFARVVKRSVDITVGSILALIAIPPIVLLAIVSAAHFRAWPIFVQRRVGRGGRTFPFPKLRTLPVSASPTADKYELARTVEIPTFGRFLRRSHLDELPQLFLVPLGWMSLVGPRPEMPRVFARYPTEFAARRTSVRPGCTGLWQISEGCTDLIHESPEYDVLYLERGRARLDWWILYQTFRRLVPRWRPITLEDVPAWALLPEQSDDRLEIDLREELDLERGEVVPQVVYDHGPHVRTARRHGHEHTHSLS